MSDPIMHNGYRISVVHDYNTTSPLEVPIDSEGELVGLVYSSNELETIGDLNTPTLTRDIIKRNAKAICELLNSPSLIALGREHHYSYRVDIEEVVESAVDAHLEYCTEKEKLYAMGELFKIAGLPYVLGSGYGYSQGDWHEIFLAPHPGLPCDYTDVPAALKSLSDTYTKWRYGDTYGYQIDKPIKCHCCGHVEYEQVDSCYGFIGRRGDDDFECMMNQARDNCADL